MRNPKTRFKTPQKNEIDLTKLESLEIVLQGIGGRELINLSFSRAYESPQISITIIDSSGKAGQTLTVFDCKA
jgi:hypothetical protein